VRHENRGADLVQEHRAALAPNPLRRRRIREELTAL
jgi:hypothetical protein